jgi:putative transposase
MMKTFEYRLYPNRRQRELLMRCLIVSRHLYNEMLALVKDHHAQTGEFLFKYALTARFKGRGGECVPASTVQMLADRLDKALRRFVARKKRGQAAGFPRFKAANRWHSIHLRQYGKGRDVRLGEGRLKVPGKLGKSIKVKQHRPFEGVPRTVYLRLRADGKWYVLIVCELEDPPVLQSGSSIGIDVGLKVFLADSEGNKITRATCDRATRSSAERSANFRDVRRAPIAARRRPAPSPRYT